MKNQKGITLVALVITIIVMLILVSVSIAIIINSDLFGSAEKAADKTSEAYKSEGEMSETVKIWNETLGNYENVDISSFDTTETKTETPNE